MIAETQGQSAGRCRVLWRAWRVSCHSDVQDSVAQPLGLASFVFPVEGELLGPDRHIVRSQRELQPRGVSREGVKREM